MRALHEEVLECLISADITDHDQRNGFVFLEQLDGSQRLPSRRDTPKALLRNQCCISSFFIVSFISPFAILTEVMSIWFLATSIFALMVT